MVIDELEPEMKLDLAAISTLFSLALFSPAFAHSHLQLSDPVDGAELSTPPDAITITFTEQPEVALSRILVTDANGAVVDSGKPMADAQDKNTLHLKLPTLNPGAYKVNWDVTSVDTHKSGGNFGFQVK